MCSFLMQAIPFLRTTCDASSGEFLSALEEVIELENRYVIKCGGRTALADIDDILIGSGGLGVSGTSLLIPFDGRLAICDRAPDHFHMPAQPPSTFRRTAFCFVSGVDRSFGMIARDDDMEPGRHFRESLTEAMGCIKKISSMEGRVPTVMIEAGTREPQSWKGLMIGEDGFHSPLMERRICWDDVMMFEIGDRIRLTCRDAIVDISA